MGSLRHERFGNGSVEMSLSSCFICESIEDSEASASESKCEPQGGCRLPVRKLEPCIKNAASSSSFPGFASRRTKMPTVIIPSHLCGQNWLLLNLGSCGQFNHWHKCHIGYHMCHAR